MGPIYTGDSGVQFIAPMQNPAIVLDGTWTVLFYIGLENGPLRPYTGTFTDNGASACYTLVGTELPTPGNYVIEIHVSKGAITKKCRVSLVVQAAEA